MRQAKCSWKFKKTERVFTSTHLGEKIIVGEKNNKEELHFTGKI